MQQMPLKSRLYYHISKNGTGWYWEVLAPHREVLQRGLADSDVQARAQAMREGIAQLSRRRLPRVQGAS